MSMESLSISSESCRTLRRNCLRCSAGNYTRVSCLWSIGIREQRPGVPVQRAARFLYLVRASYGVDMKSLGYGFRQRPGYNPAALYALIAQAHHRLARVYIERLDFRDLILRYDRPTTLFYLDPPYPGLNKTGYEGGLMEEDHRELAALLQTVKGKWVLSYSDCPLVQDLYRGLLKTRGTME